MKEQKLRHDRQIALSGQVSGRCRSQDAEETCKSRKNHENAFGCFHKPPRSARTFATPARNSGMPEPERLEVEMISGKAAARLAM